ncbi:hypothetical protein ATANTOWER_011632 [Ataeniobius toweri]|uniref:Uncharacterized protein n=1 Tax=Ataeniobius toweri TaxID=208326 RepID=A0ABU7B7E5_9TELE|nr:hypothetical protein [Ataeniobius toweri]
MNYKKSPTKAKGNSFQYGENDLTRSCRVFLFIMSDSKLVQIAFIDAASCLPPPFYLPRCHSVRNYSCRRCCCCICPFLSHFAQIRAHGRRDLPVIFWVFMKSLPHFSKQSKNVRSPGLRGVPVDPHIATPEMKTKGTTASRKYHQHIIFWCQHRRAKESRGSSGDGGILTAAVGKGSSLIQDSAGGEIYSICRGFSDFFLKLRDV